MMEFDLLLSIVQITVALFVFAIGVAVVAVIALYFIDITQTKQAVRRNFPVIGRMRYFFEHLGEFFRQYFFAQDREEMPFNRAERSYVYRAAKGVDSTLAFGSTRDLRPMGTIIFANAAFPPLDQDVAATGVREIGPFARHPYRTASLFNISGMSYGAISKPAALALSHGARKAGIWLNTGEGGLSPHHLAGGCDVVFQIGTAKYGVRDADGNLSDEKLREVAAHEQVRMFELKLSQGAKPGKGGILPAAKVTAEIAAIRGIPEGQDSISPNRHPDIASVGDLLTMLGRIREVTGKPVGFKAVIGSYGWLEDLFQEVQRRGVMSAPDFITIDSGDGGTGAAPMSLMDYVGLPIKESLATVVDLRDRAGLNERIRLIVSGKLVTPAEAAWALCVGADFVQSARGFMFSLGCIQALQCNRNTCPTGITTHNERLQKGLDPADKAERVARYAEHMHHEIGVIAHSCGVSEPRQLQRSHCLIVCDDGRSRALDQIYPPMQKPAGEGESASLAAVG